MDFIPSAGEPLIIHADEMVHKVSSMSRSYRIVLLLFALFILSVSALAENHDQYTINISSSKFLGQFLVNQSGFTLYYFSDDSTGNGGSTCYGDCASTWIPFFAGVVTVPDSLRATDFATITRTDGSKQTTIKGWPLYLYSGDKAAGDTYGSEKKTLWHVVNPSDMSQLL
jgi:predicted lipoprotein with Yx(FWY)xxD motif